MIPLTKVYLAYLNEESVNELILPTAVILFAIYKRYLSKAAKACKGKSPYERKSCTIKYQIDGKKEQLKKLKQLSGQCKSAQNPNMCNKKLLEKAKRINKEIQKLLVKYKKASDKIKALDDIIRKES